MSDKKLTDAEIVKALEACCIEHSCSKCPYSKNNAAGCINNVMKNALDLISDLQAENEGLGDEIEYLQEIIDDLYETIE